MNKRLNFEKHYLNLINDVFKDKIDDYKVISGNEGKELYGNIVIEINKKWIFRFSRREIDIKQLEIEKFFLKLTNIKYEKINC